MPTATPRCEHWIGAEHRYCHATDRVRPYLVGPRCPTHTPAALAGQPEPPSTPLTATPPATRPDPVPVPTRKPDLMPETLPILAAALDYAARGWPVFLLGRSKRPVANCPSCPKDDADHAAACACLTCHGFYAATSDPDRITVMVERVPGGLLAIRTGRASGLLVVDIDPRNGGSLDPALMVPTATVATGGGGWHLYYAHPGGLKSGKLPDRPGVDIKAEGGYVVAPPAWRTGAPRPYQWVGTRPVIEVPHALLDTYQPAPAAPATTLPPAQIRPPRLAGARGISSPEALLQANLDAVRRAGDGRRRVTLYGAARGLARMVSAGALSADDARTQLTAIGREVGGVTDREIRAAIDGGFRDEGVAA